MELAWTQGGLIPATRKEPGAPGHMAGHVWRQKLHLVWVMHLLISSELNFLSGAKKRILLISHSCSIQVEFFLVTCLVLKSGSEVLARGASALLILCLFLLWRAQNLYKMAHINVFDWTFTCHWRDWGAWRYPWASHLTAWGVQTINLGVGCTGALEYSAFINISPPLFFWKVISLCFLLYSVNPFA